MGTRFCFNSRRARRAFLVLSSCLIWNAADELRCDSGKAPPGTEMTPEAIVRSAYSKLQEALVKSGTETRISVDSIETIDRARFHAIRLRDVVSIQPRVRVQVHRGEMHFNDALVAVTYTPSIERRNRDENDPNNLYDPTLEEAMQTRVDEGETEPVLAITTYQVSAEILGETLRYRAYFLWLELPTSAPSGRFIINDHVLDRVPDALAERDPIMSKDEAREALRQKQREFDDSLREGGATENPSCITDQKSYLYPSSWHEDDYHHEEGDRHWSYAAPEYLCSCDGTCTSRASSQLRGSICTDDGDVTRMFYDHFEQTSDRSEDRARADATDGRGAVTALAFACYMRECLATGCGTQLQITPVVYPGGSIGFTYQGPGVIWDGQHSFGMECGGCTQEQPHPIRPGRPGRGPFHRTPEDPGGGGGGPNGCMRVTFFCEPQPAHPSACNGNSPCIVEYCTMICWD